MGRPQILPQLQRKYNLPQCAEYFLDSINWQLKNNRGNSYRKGASKRVVARLCEIASRYDNPIAALRAIDDSIEVYVEMLHDRSNDRRVLIGNFEELFRQEEEAYKAGGLSFNGLQDRIDECLLGMKCTRD